MDVQKNNLEALINYIMNVIEDKPIRIYFCNKDITLESDYGDNIFFVKRINGNENLINRLFNKNEELIRYVNDERKKLYKLEYSYKDYDDRELRYKRWEMPKYYYEPVILDNNIIKINLYERIDTNLEKLYYSIKNYLLKYLNKEEKIINYNSDLLMVTKYITTYPCIIAYNTNKSILNEFPFLLEGVNHNGIPIFIERSIFNDDNECQLTLLLNRYLLYSAVYNLIK